MSGSDHALAIVGGGIAGLALALHLDARGIVCRVFESASHLQELGVGIMLLPHAVRELASLKLDQKAEAVAIENLQSAFFNRFGQRIYSEARGRADGYPFPELGIHRGRLHLLLYAEVQARLGPGSVVTDRRCVGLDQDDAGVTLHFETAAGMRVPSERAHAVIACDGVNSAVRRHYYPKETVRYTGINTWRGVTRCAPILDGRTYIRIGSIKTGKIVAYPIVAHAEAGMQLVNWVAEIQSPDAPPNDWNRTANSADVLPLVRGWRYDWLDVEQLVARADAVFEYPMVDKDPIARWTFGRVTFAGDAAHPMYPRGSNGSAQALIDVRTLADALAREANPQVAFRAYESARRSATARVVEANRTVPPDLINTRVEELTGDKPFEDLDAVIAQEELRAISENYKRIAGFDLADLLREV
jgi:2-polyprenyl-6-methoxyphenol hydroxylase-like FAD-dependent oxidoreductase